MNDKKIYMIRIYPTNHKLRDFERYQYSLNFELSFLEHISLSV